MAKFKLKPGQKNALIILGIEILVEGGKAGLRGLKDWNDRRKAAQSVAEEQKQGRQPKREKWPGAFRA